MRKTDELLKKYWEGKTTLEEERWLKESLHWEEDTPQDAEYFKYLVGKSKDTLEAEDFDKDILAQLEGSEKKSWSISINYWRVAAAIIILITAGIVFNQFNNKGKTEELTANNVVITDTYEDPKKAFEETKKALMFLSGKLNEGGAYTMEIGKFNESQEILKKE